MGGPEIGNFPLLYVIKMSLRRGWVVLKSLKAPLRNIKMVPYALTLSCVHYSKKNMTEMGHSYMELGLCIANLHSS